MAAEPIVCFMKEDHKHPETYLTENHQKYLIDFYQTGLVRIYENSEFKEINIDTRTLEKEKLLQVTESPENAADFILTFDEYDTGDGYKPCSDPDAKDKIIQAFKQENNNGYSQVKAKQGDYEISILRRYYDIDVVNDPIPLADWDSKNVEISITGISEVVNPDSMDVTGEFTIMLSDGIIIHPVTLKKSDNGQLVQPMTVTFKGVKKVL